MASGKWQVASERIGRSMARESARLSVGKLNKSSFCLLIDCLPGPVTGPPACGFQLSTIYGAFLWDDPDPNQ